MTFPFYPYSSYAEAPQSKDGKVRTSRQSLRLCLASNKTQALLSIKRSGEFGHHLMLILTTLRKAPLKHNPGTVRVYTHPGKHSGALKQTQSESRTFICNGMAPERMCCCFLVGLVRGVEASTRAGQP
eukprot:771065-Pelagomonas_calceolata.AAC.4